MKVFSTMNENEGIHILIVDDEVDQLRTMKLGLRRKGYAVTTATSGVEAMDKLNAPEIPFHMVITDYAMPGMDGITFLKEIRMLNKQLTVVLMTAYGRNEVLAEAINNQCNGYIEKPFCMDEFILEIEKIRNSAH